MKSKILIKNNFVVLSKDETNFSIDQSEITKIIKKENITLFFFKKEISAVLIISKKLNSKAVATGKYLSSLKMLLAHNDNKVEGYCESNIISLSPEINIFNYYDNLKLKLEKSFMKSLKKDFFEDWANSDDLNYPISLNLNDCVNFSSIGDISKNIEEQDDYSLSHSSFNGYFIKSEITNNTKKLLDITDDFDLPSGFDFYIESNEFYRFEQQHGERRHGMNTTEFISIITKPFIINICLYHKSTKTIIPFLSVETKMGFDTFYNSITKLNEDNHYSYRNDFPSKPKDIINLLTFYQISLFIDDMDFNKPLSWAKDYFVSKKLTIEERVKRISEVNAKNGFCDQLSQFVGKKD
jgi:hypothetical protein